jgi:hypothetical protein
VIAADPVWSGLAWALVFGMTASAVLSILAIPVLYERVVRKTFVAATGPGGGAAAEIVAAARSAAGARPVELSATRTSVESR